MLASFAVFAQETVNVAGKVKSASNGELLIGVNVFEKGSLKGTITDIDGNFALTINKGGILSVSYIGFKPQELQINESNSSLVINLEEEVSALEQVVVIGYGTQKRSVVTAAIAGISSDELQGSSARVDNALKGLASGVNVTSISGQPGAGSQIRVRGIGTINNSDPLYVVDGMPIDGGIDYLNPNDIERIEVLKDAASGAVYGARAANGVILVTTKKGKKGALKVNYNFAYSLQSPWKQRDMLNATEYATLMNEGSLNAGEDIIYRDPASLGEGTNWQDEVFYNNAPMVDHEINFSGASDAVNYYFSAGYFAQDGIVGGNYDRSNYKRLSLRSNTLYTLIDKKDRNWLNSMNAGLNVSYSHINSTGIDANSEFGSVLGSALTMSPILTVYSQDEEADLAMYSTTKNFTPVRDKDGKLYTIAGTKYNEITNPLATLSLPGTEYWTDKIVSNMFVELGIWDNLKFRSSIGTDMGFWGNDGYVKKFWLNPNNYADRSKVYSQMNKGLTWQLENTLSYDKQVNDDHHFSILLGQSAMQYTGRQIGGSNFDMIEEDGDKANIGFTTGMQSDGDMAVYGGAFNPHTLSSLFARASYDYKGKYMAQFTIRRDGSSNFGPENHYASFPSFSLGWNITEEQFMENLPDWMGSAKLRFSWGKNGNESIGAFGFTSLTQTGNNYIFGVNESVVNGTKPSKIANPYLCWEESKQTDAGIDMDFFRGALTVTIDWYKKETAGMLMEQPIPGYVGEAKPTANVGTMKNSGWEFDVNYRWSKGPWKFRIGANASWLNNELIKLGNDTGYNNLDSFQGVGTITRAENGYPYPYFYGYKTNGIFQNMEQVENYVNADGKKLQPKAVPGDVIFVDYNNDGVIDDADQTMIGKGMPDWTYGINFSAEYKGFDFAMMLQGVAGCDIFDATRRTDIRYANLPTWMLDRWTGEGTSNRIPRFVFGDNTNWLSSDLFVTNGSYLRLKNVELGYTLPNRISKKAFINKFRVYVAAQNLFTFTKYEGFDPEIGGRTGAESAAFSCGVDKGIYPQARVISFGLNVGF